MQQRIPSMLVLPFVFLATVAIAADPLTVFEEATVQPNEAIGLSVVAEGNDFQPSINRAVSTTLEKTPALEKNMATVNPFNSTNATAIIGRPSWDSLLDSAIDFSNKDGTISFSLSPALLVDPYPNWYWANAKITGSANTDDGSVSVGGKYDLDFTDPRYYFNHVAKDRVVTQLKAGYGPCNNDEARIKELARIWRSIPSDDTKRAAERQRAKSDWTDLAASSERCHVRVLNDVLQNEWELKKKADASTPSFSVAGSINYNSKEGSFDGANATLAAGWKLIEPFGKGSTIPLTANLSYEDAIEKTKKDSDDTKRDQQAGGGVEVAFRQQFDLLGGDRTLEVGGAFTALACLDTPCANTRSTLRINPFLAIAITDSIGGRVDVVWEGNGDDFGSAVAGMSMSYSFSSFGGS